MRTIILATLTLVVHSFPVSGADVDLHCYGRDYSALHLAQHPDQTVRNISLLVLPEKQTSGQPFSFVIGARFRGSVAEAYAFGTCGWSSDENDPPGVLRCAAECGGQTFSIRANEAGRALLVLGGEGQPGSIEFNSTCGAEPGAIELKSGIDDQMFALVERPSSECSDLLAAREAPPDADKGSIIDSLTQSTWAISSAQNCRLPSKTYRLTHHDDAVMWTDGGGSEDTERVISETGSVFEAVTETSNHIGRPGEVSGVRWKYVVTDGRVAVTRNGRHAFDLVLCR